MSVDWQWQEMTWHRTITPAAAGAGLERLATAVELGTVVLELRVGAEGAHWLVGTGTHRGRGTAELLYGLLPVRVHPPTEGRRPVSRAARLLAAGDRVSDLPERVAAAVRALYAAMTGLSGEQGLVVQLLLGHRLSPAFFTRPQTPLWYQLLNGYDAPPSHRAARPADEQHGAAALPAPGVRRRAGLGAPAPRPPAGSAAGGRDRPGPLAPQRRGARAAG